MNMGRGEKSWGRETEGERREGRIKQRRERKPEAPGSQVPLGLLLPFSAVGLAENRSSGHSRLMLLVLPFRLWVPLWRSPEVSCPVSPHQQSCTGGMKSFLLTPWHIYRLCLSAETGGYHFPLPRCYVYSRPCARGAFIKGPRGPLQVAKTTQLLRLEGTWGKKKKKHPVPGLFSGLYLLKIRLSDSARFLGPICTLTLNGQSAHLFFVRCVSKTPLFLLNNERETLRFPLEGWGRGCRQSLVSSVLAASSEVRVRQTGAALGRQHSGPALPSIFPFPAKDVAVSFNKWFGRKP